MTGGWFQKVLEGVLRVPNETEGYVSLGTDRKVRMGGLSIFLNSVGSSLFSVLDFETKQESSDRIRTFCKEI